MTTAAYHVSADITWLQKEIVKKSLQDVWDMKKESARIVCLITGWKEEFVKFKDVWSTQDTIAENVQKNMIL